MEVDLEQLRKKATLTVSEAAAVTGMCEETIRRYARNPKETAFQCFGSSARGRKIRILAKPFFRALDGQQVNQ